MKIPLLDLKAQYAAIKTELHQAVADVFESQTFILGPAVEVCERELANYCGCVHALGVSSGTDALLLALMCEDIGVGDEVVTTPYTFFSTAGSIARCGARPVFVDIDPVDYNINPALLPVAITPQTRAMMPVHLYGQAADMDPILDLAREKSLVVIEDAAQAIGAEYHGRRAGAMGDYGCFSFYPSKNLGAAGEGGLVVTGSDQRMEKCKCLRVHGSSATYVHPYIGGNFRFDAIQAAVVRVKLRHLDNWTSQRQRNAARYDALLHETGLVERGLVQLPRIVRDRHVFNQYIVRVERRDDLMQHLRDQEIGCAIYYPIPLHLQDCFAYLGYARGDFPESERAAQETLALPIYPELGDEAARHLVHVMASFYGL